MDQLEGLLQYLEIVYSNKGLPELEKLVARGDFIGDRLAVAEKFIRDKKNQQLAAYLMSPEYSALRQANAAEQSNKTAHRAYVVSLIAAAMSLAALLLQLFPRAG